ncbi:reverse transcriptase domain, reverse transcriptase zinc-binding domain protein, partial [Tanacetum coccineum]
MDGDPVVEVDSGQHRYYVSPDSGSYLSDLIQWKNRKGVISLFFVAKAWEELRPRGFKVKWTRVVWFSHCIPRHSFHLWLTLRGSLRTQDKLRQWDVGNVDL